MQILNTDCVLKCFQLFTWPIALYLDLTVAEPCKNLTGKISDSDCGCSKSSQPATSQQPTASMPPASTASQGIYFCKLLKKQRQMCSPEVPEQELRDQSGVCQRYMTSMYKQAITLEHLPSSDYLH